MAKQSQQKTVRTIKGGASMLESTHAPEETYSPLQLHFLRRLNRLLHLRGDQSGQLNQDGARLIDVAIYSTYRDAGDLGITDEAQKLLRKHSVSAQ